MSSVAAAYSQVPLRAKYFKAVPKMTLATVGGVTNVATDLLGPAVYTIIGSISATMTSGDFDTATTESNAAAQRLTVNSRYINKGKTVTVVDADGAVTATYALVRPVVAGEDAATDDVLVKTFDLTDSGNVRVVAA
jgi:phosphoribosylaminoimidazole (AIR) synthetase